MAVLFVKLVDNVPIYICRLYGSTNTTMDAMLGMLSETMNVSTINLSFWLYSNQEVVEEATI